MISKTQLESLALLRELCDMSPDVRLGQLMAHLGFLGEDQTGRTLWDLDDDELLAVMVYHRAELKNRSSQLGTQVLSSLESETTTATTKRVS